MMLTVFYQINMCLDGMWQAIIVDSYLPVIYRNVVSDSKSASVNRQNRKREGFPVGYSLWRQEEEGASAAGQQDP